jgi:hypothetical protein
MTRAMRMVLLSAMLLAAGGAYAGCWVCIPRCADVSTIAGQQGRVNCISSSSYCTIWGTLCEGGAGECQCGTRGCSPCNPVCAPEGTEWRLAFVEVTSPRLDVAWTLVSVQPSQRAARRRS